MSILNNYVRQAGVFTKLPCGSNWYKNGEIDFLLNDEVSVLPMSHKDELLSHNADALYSSNAVYEIIKSCVPNVKDVKKLLIPDVEVLLLAIKIASTGNEIEVSTVCPKCLEVYNKSSEEERIRLQKEKLISIEPQDYLFDAKLCLEQFKPKENQYILEFEKFKVHCIPMTLEDSSKLDILNFEIRNALNIYLEESKKEGVFEENVKILSNVDEWKTNMDKNTKLNNLLVKLDDIVVDTLISSIICIEVAEGREYDKEAIKNFLLQIPGDMFVTIRNYINSINETSLDKTMECQCQFCNHTWVNESLEFDISRFFGKSSSR